MSRIMMEKIPKKIKVTDSLSLSIFDFKYYLLLPVHMHSDVLTAGHFRVYRPASLTSKTEVMPGGNEVRLGVYFGYDLQARLDD